MRGARRVVISVVFGSFGTVFGQACDSARAVYTRATSGGFMRYLGTQPIGECGDFTTITVPAGVKIGANGNVFVWGQNAGPVTEFHRTTGAAVRTIVAAGSGGSIQGRDLEFMPNGDILIGGGSSNKVVRFRSSDGAYVGDFIPSGSGGLSTAFGMCFGPNGNLYVASSGTNQILEYNGQTGVFIRVFSQAGSGMVGPYDVTFGPDGHLYTTAVNEGAIYKFDGLTGASLGRFNQTLVPPSRGLMFGPNGNLFVCCWGGPLGAGLYEFDRLTGSIVRLASAGNAAMFVDFDCFIGSSFLEQPVDQALCEGGSFAISAVIAGKGARYQWRKDGVSLSDARAAFFRVQTARLSDAGLYDCVVTTDCGVRISSAAQVEVHPAPAPSIIQQPIHVNIDSGDIAAFSIMATGAGPLTYRWRLNGNAIQSSSRIVGVNTPQLVISDIQPADQGLYDCIVTNGCASIVSQSASLSCRPEILRQPQGGSVFSGQALTISPQLSINGNSTFRWQKNGVNLFNGLLYSGVTTDALRIIAEDPVQTGSYSLTISNPCGPNATIAVPVVVICLADFNRDGAVDSDDVISFFGLWDASTVAADVNNDGGIDSDDVILFFDRWDVGC
jgi:WD40 repeat protein